jgi:methylphosphotriester-DNA--protein-cysteine methyltransferase
MMKTLAIVKTALLIAILVSTVITAQSGVLYRGNVDSKIFHQSSCRYFNCKSCTATFSSREAAINAGYRPCKVCKP